MSELEIQRRQEYKRNRKKWTMIQLVAIALLAVLALGSFLIYHRIDQTQYIEYTEKSGINYKVQYQQDDFFGEWLEQNQAYISSNIRSILASFAYDMSITSDQISLAYEYWIDAKLTITDKYSGAAYYTVEEHLLPATSKHTKSTSSLNIAESVSIDYPRYDALARTFIDTYNLKDGTSNLTVTLYVKTNCSNKNFKNDCRSIHSTTMSIPLAVDTFSIQSTSASPADEVKVFEYQNVANRILFLTISIVTASLAVLLAIVLLGFLHLTKNEDITYATRIRKIFGSYGSFIQRINGEFDSDGYQIIMIKTFPEMLGIRDTIQSPVLAFENGDETMTRFFIPTNTKILYVFELKVDNYDEIYSKVEELEVEEPEVEEPVILEEVDEEVLAMAMVQPDVDLSEIEFIPDDDDQFEVAPEEPGIEVVGVVWPEKARKNKVYRYDPNGETLHEGDIVLVPTMDHSKGREVIRKVAVAHGNHRVAPEHIKHPLKKIIAVIKRTVAHSLTPSTNKKEKH